MRNYWILKTIIFIAFGFMGVFMLLLPHMHVLNQGQHFSVIFTSNLILTISGIIMCFFVGVTILIRDEEDVWR